MMLAKESLGIFWLVDETRFSTQRHDKCDGFIIHRLWRDEPSR